MGNRTMRVLAGWVVAAGLLQAQPRFDWRGQPMPGPVAVPFAPGILNTGLATRDITWLPDGSALYVGVFLPGFRNAVIIETHREGERWSAPEVAAFSRDPRWRCLEPCISPDGQRFFFVSDRPADPQSDKPGPFGIWVMERAGSTWSEPQRLPGAVNGTVNVFYPTITWSGVLHFLQEEGQGGWLMRSTWKAGTWTPAEKLPPPFNADNRQANPRVDPEERFILVPMMGRSDSLGGADYYAYFHAEDGSWTAPVHLGTAVNSAARDEFSINISPDGKVLFFGSDRALPRLEGKSLRWIDLLEERTLPGNGQTTLWWVDAGFFWALRAKTLGVSGGAQATSHASQTMRQ